MFTILIVLCTIGSFFYILSRDKQDMIKHNTGIYYKDPEQINKKKERTI